MPDTSMVISIAEERFACGAVREELVTVLRRRQHDRCWFCKGHLPAKNSAIDLHHIVPLHIAFPDGQGHPSTIEDLSIVHRKCHQRKPRSIK
jgi:5-methylcytosine-specific restriction endonuclease McrA